MKRCANSTARQLLEESEGLGELLQELPRDARNADRLSRVLLHRQVVLFGRFHRDIHIDLQTSQSLKLAFGYTISTISNYTISLSYSFCGYIQGTAKMTLKIPRLTSM